MNTKNNEIKYVDNLTADEKRWLSTKPFGNFNYQESLIRIRDFSYIIELLSLQNSKSLSLLDLGCGPGWTSIMLAKLGLDVTAVDISKDMISIAKANAQKDHLKVTFEVDDIEEVNFRNKFDRVLLYDALHHCPNELKVIKNAYEALKPGGIILVIEPNKRHGYDKSAQKTATRFGVLEKGYSPHYLKKEMRKTGFKNIVRYDCDYRVNKAAKEGVKSFLKQSIRFILARLIWSHYSFQVWLKAEK